MTGLAYGYLESPIGLIEIGFSADAVASLSFVEQKRFFQSSDGMVADAVKQLEAYFAGTRKQFDLKLSPAGTDFQQSVWREVARIPFGQTTTYQAIAGRLNNPGSVRAVGLANGHNPIAIIIPCHRVIGTDGSLTGYGGGLWRKEWLLKHEGALLL